jgi:hypothetical protein
MLWLVRDDKLKDCLMLDDLQVANKLLSDSHALLFLMERTISFRTGKEN